VARTFALAIEEAAKLHTAAEPLIVHAAMLAPEPIPLSLFSETREKFGEPLASALAGDGLDEAVAALRTFALLDRETIVDEGEPSITTECIRLHRLVRQVALARLDSTAREAMLRTLVAAVVTVYPHRIFNNPNSWPQARRVDGVAYALINDKELSAKGLEKQTSGLLDRLGSYRHSAIGAYKQAKPLFERALEIRETFFGLDHPETVTSITHLALLLREQGDLGTARALFERALASREKRLGPNHPVTATSLNNLALVFLDQGDCLNAQPLFERALGIREKVLRDDHPDIARNLNNLGRVRQAQGDLVGAQRFYERALAIGEKMAEVDPLSLTTPLNNLGAMLYVQGNRLEARKLFERALTIREKTLGPEHPRTSEGRCRLARALLGIGEALLALTQAERALAAHSKMLGVSHPWTKDSARVTADALDALGRSEEAAAVRKKYGLQATTH
jgi:tetratricopeptide (TPR) repeat protein